MCEFCHQHGEGKKWYLEAKNYSDDLLSDIKRKQVVIKYLNDTDSLRKQKADLDKLRKAPKIVQQAFRLVASPFQKKEHFGQVLPIEDVEKIFGFVTKITRLSCMCRYVTLGSDQRYCYGISLGPSQGSRLDGIMKGLDGSFLGGPDLKGMEEISKEKALENFRKYERQGLCHTVWTFKAPFIMGVCNCDRSDCLAMKAGLEYEFPVMFRAEYVAESNPDLCKGCRKCMQVCQFGAIGFSAANKKSYLDPLRCYGCGICRTVCKESAITLKDRRNVPLAANLWQ